MFWAIQLGTVLEKVTPTTKLLVQKFQLDIFCGFLGLFLKTTSVNNLDFCWATFLKTSSATILKVDLDAHFANFGASHTKV